MRIAAEETCEFLEGCRFFNNPDMQSQQDLQDLVDMFCRGAENMECCRRRFFLATGRIPPDGMLPNGQMLRLSGATGGETG